MEKFAPQLLWYKWARRKASERADRGRKAERLAQEFLIAKGYSLIEKNVRYPVGEIDLIATEGKVLCFVEVRSCSLTNWVGPAESITLKKRQRIIRAAEWYLNSHPADSPHMRFDVVSIVWKSAKDCSIELIRGAFDAQGDA